MKSDNTLHLLSKESEKLGFGKMKTTLDKIAKVDLCLTKELNTEILEISHSLGLIVAKNLHSKKSRIDVKIKSSSEEINCEDVSVILSKSNELLIKLLGEDDKEGVAWYIEEIEKEVLGYKELSLRFHGEINPDPTEEEIESNPDILTTPTKDLYLESIRYRKDLRKRFENIELLEEIIKEINDFREHLDDLLNGKVITPVIEKINNVAQDNKKELVEKEIPVIEEKEKEVILKSDESEETENNIEESNDNVEVELFDYETSRLIKINLKNKKIELPKQNSLFNEVKEFSDKGKRITFYDLGLYKLNLGFSNGKSLNFNNVINVISLLNINDSSKFFIEGKFGNSDNVMSSLLGKMIDIGSRLDEKYFGLCKKIHYHFLNISGRGKIGNDKKQEYSNKYKSFLRSIEMDDQNVEDFDLDSIKYSEIKIEGFTNEEKEALHSEYLEELGDVKRRKVRKQESIRRNKGLVGRPKTVDTVVELIIKKKKLTKSYNIDIYTKILSHININKFKEFYDIDKEYFLKVGSAEVINLYITALNRLKGDFENDEFNEIEGFLNQYIVFINNGVKKLPSINKNGGSVVDKDELLYIKNIEFHLNVFNKEGNINNGFNIYLEKNITNKEFIKFLIKGLLSYNIAFVSEFLTECGKFFDIKEIITILEIDNDITLKIKGEVSKTATERKIDKIMSYNDEESFIEFYKKEAANFATKNDIEYFVAFLDKFIQFEYKSRALFTIKGRILRIDENHIFSEDQNIYFDKINEDKKKEQIELEESIRINKEKKEEEKSQNKIDNDKKDKENVVKKKIRDYAKNGEYKELQKYYITISEDIVIDDIFYINMILKSMTNSNETKELLDFLYKR